MMVQIGLGLAPSTLRALPTQQPAQGLTVVVASDDKAVTVSATAMTIQVAPPSTHAGSYPLVLADLARGPVCLVAPAIRASAGTLAGTLTVEPGLWAYDAARGATTITRQWRVDGTAVQEATGLTFEPVATDAAQAIVVAETVRQDGVETASLSESFTLPAMTAPEAARLAVTSDARLEIVADSSDTAKVEVTEPAIYAGDYTILAAELKNGPLWLASARIQGSGQVGSQLSVMHRGLYVSDADAGPVALQGQWQRDGAPIPDATAETYDVQAADAGGRIGFLETATDSHGTRPQLSNEIAIGGTS